MILAAGLGTRLGPVGAALPKALLRVGSTTLLERTLERLVVAGADRVVVNVHHHADLMEAALARLSREPGAPEILVSRERERLLETGGGLLHAAPLLRRDAPFFLHNVDVISDCDLAVLYRVHQQAGGLATLAVHERQAARELLFDRDGLFGRLDHRTGREEKVRAPAGPILRRAFAGIHVISPGVFEVLDQTGVFSIVDAYLRLAGAGHAVLPHDVSGSLWLEVGTPERLEEARLALET